MKKQRKSRLIEGLPVVDAKKDLKIQITLLDVKNSKKSDPANCAAAVACKRQTHKEVRVYLTKTYIKIGNHWTRFHTPERISREIIAFDRGSNFVPGIYEIKAPVGMERLGCRTKISKIHTQNKKLQVHHMTKEVRSYREQTK